MTLQIFSAFRFTGGRENTYSIYNLLRILEIHFYVYVHKETIKMLTDEFIMLTKSGSTKC